MQGAGRGWHLPACGMLTTHQGGCEQSRGILHIPMPRTRRRSSAGCTCATEESCSNLGDSHLKQAGDPKNFSHGGWLMPLSRGRSAALSSPDARAAATQISPVGVRVLVDDAGLSLSGSSYWEAPNEVAAGVGEHCSPELAAVGCCVVCEEYIVEAEATAWDCGDARLCLWCVGRYWEIGLMSDVG